MSLHDAWTSPEDRERQEMRARCYEIRLAREREEAAREREEAAHAARAARAARIREARMTLETSPVTRVAKNEESQRAYSPNMNRNGRDTRRLHDFGI